MCWRLGQSPPQSEASGEGRDPLRRPGARGRLGHCAPSASAEGQGPPGSGELHPSPCSVGRLQAWLPPSLLPPARGLGPCHTPALAQCPPEVPLEDPCPTPGPVGCQRPQTWVSPPSHSAHVAGDSPSASACPGPWGAAQLAPCAFRFCAAFTGAGDSRRPGPGCPEGWVGPPGPARDHFPFLRSSGTQATPRFRFGGCPGKRKLSEANSCRGSFGSALSCPEAGQGDGGPERKPTLPPGGLGQHLLFPAEGGGRPTRSTSSSAQPRRGV